MRRVARHGMAIRVALHHRTSYRYDRLVTLGPQIVRLRPAPHTRTPIPRYSLRVRPAEHFLNWQQDPQGNYLARARLPRADARARRRGRPDRRHDGRSTRSTSSSSRAAETFPFDVRAGARRTSSRPYREAEPAGPAPARVARRASAAPRRRTIDFLVDAEPPPAARDRLRHPHGARRADAARRRSRSRPARAATPAGSSCRSSATSGFAARFVSGYLIQLDADVKPLDGPAGPDGRLHRPARLGGGLPAGRGLGRPRSDLGPARRRGTHPARVHARAGERGADRRRSSTSARPSSSSRCRSTRMREDPRVTMPYTRRAVGGDRRPRARASTRALAAGDVRLTMGGEPTFVSIDDRDGAEWNIAALGPTKRRLAGQLVRRLQAPLRAGRRSCTSARASGTRASRCRAGRSAATGAATASRCGRIRRSSPTTTATTASARPDAERFVAALARAARRRSGRFAIAGLRGRLVLPLARAAAAGERRSVRLAPRRRGRARAPRARLRARARRRRRLRAAARRRATAAGWRSGAGSSAPSACTSSPATRRWAFACRSTRCPGSRRTRARRSPSATRSSRRARRCRRTRASARAAAPVRRGGLAASGRRARWTSSAPRSASSRATAGCTSSCRRSRSPSIPRSRRRGRGDGARARRCRSWSRATRRRAIRASGSSRSRPTPASSR